MFLIIRFVLNYILNVINKLNLNILFKNVTAVLIARPKKLETITRLNRPNTIILTFRAFARK